MTIGDDDPITLKEAVEMVFRGTISVSTLRVEAERGNLDIFKVGRRYFTTLRNVRDMTQKAKVAPRPAFRPKPEYDEQRKLAAVRRAEQVAANLRRKPEPDATAGQATDHALKKLKDRQRELRKRR